MSYSHCFVYALAVRKRITLRIGLCGAKWQHNFIAELAARDQEEREATEFQLNNEKFNWSTYKQRVIKWSDMSNQEAGNIWRRNKKSHGTENANWVLLGINKNSKANINELIKDKVLNFTKLNKLKVDIT